MTYQIVDWLMTYIECFVMLVVVTESGGRKFEEKKQAYLLYLSPCSTQFLWPYAIRFLLFLLLRLCCLFYI